MYRFFVDLLQPFPILYLAALAALVNLWRRRVESKRRLWLLTAPMILLAILCTPAVAHLSMALLEWQYPPHNERPAEVQAIVVLSGFAFRPNEEREYSLLALDSQFRCQHAAMLYHQGPPCPVILSGGKVEEEDEGDTLAALMRDYLVKLGVPAEDIVLEERSRNTYENAVYTAEILAQREIDNIALVTSASHLMRAVLCFEAQDLAVTASGCEYTTIRFNWSLLTFLPNADAAGANHRAFHEWAGMLVYWLRGRF